MLQNTQNEMQINNSKMEYCKFEMPILTLHNAIRYT